MNIQFGAQFNLIPKGASYGMGGHIDAQKLGDLTVSLASMRSQAPCVLYKTDAQKEELFRYAFLDDKAFQFSNADELSPVGAVILTEEDAEKFNIEREGFKKAGLEQEYLASVPSNPIAKPIYM